MTLLEQAIELYKGILAARPKTDPMVLQMQTFIATHFQHEGTKAMRAADAEKIDYTYKGKPNKMQPFIHPNSKAAQALQSKQNPQPEGKEEPKKGNALKSANIQQNPAVQKPGELNDPSNSPTRQKGAATDVVIDEAAAKEMKPKAVAAIYPEVAIREWLTEKGVTIGQKASHVQLASLLVQTLNAE